MFYALFPLYVEGNQKICHLPHTFLPVLSQEFFTGIHQTHQLLDFSKTMPSLVSMALALYSYITVYGGVSGPSYWFLADTG